MAATAGAYGIRDFLGRVSLLGETVQAAGSIAYKQDRDCWSDNTKRYYSLILKKILGLDAP